MRLDEIRKEKMKLDDVRQDRMIKIRQDENKHHGSDKIRLDKLR
jgi:hypothetical protein